MTLFAEGMESSSVKSNCKGLQKDVTIWFCEENDTALKVLVKLFDCFMHGQLPFPSDFISVWLNPSSF